MTTTVLGEVLLPTMRTMTMRTLTTVTTESNGHNEPLQAALRQRVKYGKHFDSATFHGCGLKL
eukprot:6038807-Amphidinium_carterae.1